MIKRKVTQRKVFGKRNQRIQFCSITERNEWLFEQRILETENVKEICSNIDAYIGVLTFFQQKCDTYTLLNGTGLYIESDVSVLLLSVIHRNRNLDDITLGVKDTVLCGCEKCEERNEELHGERFKNDLLALPYAK